MYKNEKWWVSEYNFEPKVTEKFKLPSKVYIHDATLRDGEQTPGVVFSVEEKVRIAEKLSDIGVDRIEAGMPAVSKDDYNAIKDICNRGLKSEIYGFCRAKEEDIDMAAECGVDGVVIEIPVSEPKLELQFRQWDEDYIINQSCKIVQYAKKKKLKITYFGYDTTRAKWSFLERLYENIAKYELDSVGIVDTTGCILPDALKILIAKIKTIINVPIEIHTHNDFGMATANTLAAVAAGAEIVHVCVNGLGERTGNASLEEVVTGLRVLYDLDMQICFSELRNLCEYVSAVSKFPIPRNKPFIGDNTFVRESGIGIDLVLEKPLAMFSMNPAFIGNKSGVVLGKKSGLKSIQIKLAELGLDSISEDQEKALLNAIKSESIKLKSTISDDVFLKLLGKVK